MVNRSIAFLQQCSPITKCGFNMEGGYTTLVSSGDGDYLTRDTLIDLKVKRGRICARDTLQILMYYLMGLHSIHKEFQSIKKLSLFNPRSNTEYWVNVNSIPQSVTDEVNNIVIGYDDPERWEDIKWTGTGINVLSTEK